MLKLYYNRISFNSRRVWIALLEKGLPFELIHLNLDGDQYQPEFLALNPFHQIPVLEDEEFTLIESLAILDYLEAKYPTPSLLPQDPQALATVRMLELVTSNELLSATTPLMLQMLGLSEPTSESIAEATEKAKGVLQFFAKQLGDRTYFAGEELTLADIVAGTAVPFLPDMGIPLTDYPQLQAWCDRLASRESWQQTQPSREEIEAFKSQMKALLSQRQ